MAIDRFTESLWMDYRSKIKRCGGENRASLPYSSLCNSDFVIYRVYIVTLLNRSGAVEAIFNSISSAGDSKKLESEASLNAFFSCFSLTTRA